MMKVVIADDEKNICVLIQKLIDWRSLGLEVAAVAHNAPDACQCILDHRPDIVITDIRMPGYDGIELIRKFKSMDSDIDFIIISGYKYFEYAHDALRLGVEHYLLKPIDKNELTSALEKIIQKRRTVLEKEKEDEQLKLLATTSRKRMKEHFLTDIMNNNIREGMGIDEINEEYQCMFRSGIFRAAFFKIDSSTSDTSEIREMIRLVRNIIEEDLLPHPIEYIHMATSSGVLVIINYEEDSEASYISHTEASFAKVKRHVDKFYGYQLTMGVGNGVGIIGLVSESINGAVNSVKCRLKLGTGRIIYENQLQFRPVDMAEILDKRVLMEVHNELEALDYLMLEDSVEQCLRKIRKVPFYSPVAIFDLCEQFLDTFADIAKEMKIDETQIAEFISRQKAVLDNQTKEDLLLQQYLDNFNHFIQKLLLEKKNQSQLPMRMAKAYIQENFARQISLEDVGNAIHMSPAYLSTMFKKEIGINFSDYLINCRIDAAKTLLKESQKSMAEIAEAVGYNDARYFSKIFNKVVGLKPTAYRKLYS